MVIHEIYIQTVHMTLIMTVKLLSYLLVKCLEVNMSESYDIIYWYQLRAQTSVIIVDISVPPKCIIFAMHLDQYGK